MDGQPQYRAINGRHSFETPIVRMSYDQCVEYRDLFRRSFKQFVGEIARFVGRLGALPKFPLQLCKILLAHVPLKEHLHRKLARFSSERHVTCAVAFEWWLAWRDWHEASETNEPS